METDNLNFFSHVLGWTTKDYNDDGLYKKQIKEIPKFFKSGYYESFMFPFYDDLKCMIARKWNSLGGKDDVIGTIQVLEVNIGFNGSKILVTSIDIDSSKIFFNDLVLLTINDSYSLADTGTDYLLCCVSTKAQSENGLYVELSAILSNYMPEYQLLLDDKRKWKMARITSLTSHSRIYAALHAKQNFKLLKNIMNPDKSSITFKSSNETRTKLETTLKKIGSSLNEYQKQAILNAVKNRIKK